MRVTGILLLIAGLATMSAIDADGDPTTTNTPPVVLASAVEVTDTRKAGEEPSRSGDGAQRRPILSESRASRVLRATLGNLWCPRVHPIRGP